MTHTRWWPAWALAAVALIMSRAFTSTPELSAPAKKHPTAADVAAIYHDRVAAIIGSGLTWLGLACLVIFVLGLGRAARGREGSVASGLIVTGGAITAGVLLVTFSVLYEVGVALSGHYSVSSIAALDALGEIGYNGWIALGLTTAGVAVAALRDKALPRWLGWFSAVATLVLAAMVFAPFLAWFPGLLWLLVAGVGLLLRPT